MQIEVRKAEMGKEKKRLKVCAYARVSTEASEQENSLENQVSHYTEMIQANPAYEFAGVYADFGISGFKESRPQFQKMMQDAKNGKIDLIITKSVSRFARNTAIVLKASRELKERNVGIFFELQNINTLTEAGELLLTILAAFAQAESESASESSKMAYFSYKPLPGAEKQIYSKISDITISMKSTDHLRMPELVDSRYTVYLSETEREKYEELKKDLVLQLPDGEVTAANAASLSGKLSQMADGAIYTDAGESIAIHERKLDALEDIIEAAYGRPVLVAYWFRHDLERISGRLQKLKIPYARLDTDGSIRKWNAGEIPVALIHPASAGHGLNLQGGGNTLVWFGLTWSLELYQQTVARLWRQGQESETVVVQHIITKGTIDERIMKALSEKDTTQAALIDAVKADLKI